MDFGKAIKEVDKIYKLYGKDPNAKLHIMAMRFSDGHVTEVALLDDDNTRKWIKKQIMNNSSNVDYEFKSIG